MVAQRRLGGESCDAARSRRSGLPSKAGSALPVVKTSWSRRAVAFGIGEAGQFERLADCLAWIYAEEIRLNAR